ncbi:hypothetical protein CIG75_17350 [Tumebacillus algifaecis]|uniref:Nucleoside transporter/FeoB GTPase Gate domain-containing protein n=1 Tax=Tumebacillus algifaecis TaxID=1214604 RepID=A0A223D540_9BACL|nr:hypothetical protein CIG75_17350 [Tumebacillus algifaecis]
MQGVIYRGWLTGLRTTWILGKVIVPITLLVSLLKHTPVIEWVVHLFAPLMGLFGLPGEAAIVLALGFTLNLYAAIGAMFSLALNSPEILILCVMLSFCHNLFVETAVAKRLGLNSAIVVLVRFGMAFIGGVTLHLALGNQVGAVAGTYTHLAYLWEMPLLSVLGEVGGTIFKAVWQLALIVIPLMMLIQVLKERKVLDKLAVKMTPLMRMLGLSEHAAIPMLAGIWFGLAYGAGVILEATREKPMEKRELYLLMVFLVLCHAVVEDTLIFLPLGVNGWYLLAIRLVSALVLTFLLARLWRRQAGRQTVSKGQIEM